MELEQLQEPIHTLFFLPFTRQKFFWEREKNS